MEGPGDEGPRPEPYRSVPGGGRADDRRRSSDRPRFFQRPDRAPRSRGKEAGQAPPPIPKIPQGLPGDGIVAGPGRPRASDHGRPFPDRGAAEPAGEAGPRPAGHPGRRGTDDLLRSLQKTFSLQIPGTASPDHVGNPRPPGSVGGMGDRRQGGKGRPLLLPAPEMNLPEGPWAPSNCTKRPLGCQKNPAQ